MTPTMEDKPLVSVIIITYNRTEMLKRAVKSVLNQTYDNVEIIVVNDNPNRDIRDIIEPKNNVYLINHDENKKGNAARNTGIKKSNGEYISVLDDDDELKKEKIEKQINKLSFKDDSFGFVYCGTLRKDKNAKVSERVPEKRGDIFEDLLKYDFIGSGAPLIKKECFKKIGLFNVSNDNLPGDYDMWLRLAREYKSEVVSEPLFVYNIGHDDRQTKREYLRKYRALKAIIKKHWSDYKKRPKILSHKYKMVADSLIKNDVFNKEVPYYFKKAFKYNKLDFKIPIYYLISSFAPNSIKRYFFDLRNKFIQ